MSVHVHELPDWPTFRWDRERLADVPAAVRHQQGGLIGNMEALGFQLRQETVLETLTADVVKTKAKSKATSWTQDRFDLTSLAISGWISGH
jgi:hypothetical protein